MSCKTLKVQTFVVVATLSVAMLLFAAQHRDVAAGPQFRAVIDLSHSDKGIAGLGSGKTILIAPASLGGAWTLDSLPTTRLIAPLAVIEAERKNFPDSESLVTMDDVAAYERAHGAISQGAIILLVSSNKSAMPLFSHDALHFLIEARNVVGIGTAGTQIVSADENSYLAKRGIYELENVDNLSLVPRSGVIAVAAPQKISGAAEGPVRLMALVR
ncbi:MAG TPA: cyclase family protein [Terriglobales bacterium]|nr:cyclase family protein [Terriglobales bacterium]